MTDPVGIDDLITLLLPEHKAQTAAQMHALIQYLRTNKIRFAEAIPVLAMTCGTMVGMLARLAPEDEQAEFLHNGIEIACDLVRTAAEHDDTANTEK
jgi:hypothetical protein